MIEIEGRWYRSGGIQYLSLRDLVDFDVWLAQHGRSFSRWWEMPEVLDEIRALPVEDQLTHPEAELIRAVRVWATLRRSGRALSFDAALDLDYTTIHERGDEVAKAEVPLPRGFEAGNTQQRSSADIDGMDLDEEVNSRILGVLHYFPSLTWAGVWDLPLFVWMGVAAQIDELRK